MHKSTNIVDPWAGVAALQKYYSWGNSFEEVGPATKNRYNGTNIPSLPFIPLSRSPDIDSQGQEWVKPAIHFMEVIIGCVGKPSVGKSTFFNAVSGGSAKTGMSMVSTQHLPVT